jgi:signal transduction histidine kinase
VNRAALRLPGTILIAELGVGLSLLATLTIFGPQMLLLDHEVTVASVAAAFGAAGPVAVALYVFTNLRLGRHKYALRALARGSKNLEPEDVVGLTSLPTQITGMFLAVIALAIVATMLTPLRPAVLEIDAGLSLAVLGMSIAATAALPLYVIVRTAVSRVFELANPDSLSGLLESPESARRARTRLVRRVLASTATPVGFVALGATLIAHAHVRKFDQETRERTAEAISRVALESSGGTVPDSGRQEAIDVAARLGFRARIEPPPPLGFAVTRGNDGLIRLVAPLEDGSAVIQFQGSDVDPITWADLGIVVLALLVAAALGAGLGNWLADDLELATKRVRMLRTDQVVLGQEHASVSPPRFAQVSLLNRAIDTLAERFRVFASAQERAIDAREAAGRVRSLLFASVSHDLRSPLNAILGFAGLIRGRNLNPAQSESLRFIESSGRELLALIETILDSAKLDAGRLELAPSPTSLAVVLADAIRTARHTAGGRPFDVDFDLDDDLPQILADGPRLSQAIGALIWFSARTGDPSLSHDVVRAVVRARRGEQGGVVVTLNAPGCTISAQELEALIVESPGVVDRRKYGALALGLDYARAVVLLHGGTLGVAREPTATFELFVPGGGTWGTAL